MLQDGLEDFHEPDSTYETPVVSSSPVSASSRSNKPKRPPTVTPRRFNRFFDLSSSREHRTISTQSSRALRNLNSTAINQLHGRRSSSVFDEFPDVRPAKKRKSCDAASTAGGRTTPVYSDSILNSSPVYDLPSSPTPAYDQPSPCARGRNPVTIVESAHRLLPPVQRSRIVYRPDLDYRSLTANFYSSPADLHPYFHPVAPFCVATCNTNTLIAIGDEQGGIRLIESSSYQKPGFNTPYLSFQPHSNAIMHMAFSSNDQHLATGCGDQTSKVIDMPTQTTVHVLAGTASTVRHVTFQPGNDNVLAICSRDGSVNIYDIRSSKYAARIQSIAQAHFSDNLATSVTAPTKSCPSVTALQFLSPAHSHLFVTSSDSTARLRLWDIRGRYSVRQRAPVPLSTTSAPPGHVGGRDYGVTSLASSADNKRFYAVCKDNFIYAYSTNHVLLGQAPELDASTPAFKAQRGGTGLGPLYGFYNRHFRAHTFYVRAAVHSELLAVGSSEGCPVLFPTDERLLRKPTNIGGIDIYDVGTPLIRGHALGHNGPKEVPGVAWTTEGEMISVGDDFRVRCWRQDAQFARKLRLKSDGEAARFECGWADVGDEDWDEDDG